MNTNKKYVKIGAISLAIIALGIGGFSLANRNKEFTHESVDYEAPLAEEAKHITVEYGDKDPLKGMEYVYLHSMLPTELPKVDTSKVGKKEYEVKAGTVSRKFTVEVKDTKAPKFSGDKKYTITEGDSLDLSKHVKAEDPVDGEVEVKFDKKDFNKVGEHKVKATAEDKHGNKSEYDIVVVVEKKPEPKPQPKPQAPSGNTGGSSGGQRPQSRPQKPSGNTGGGSSNSGGSSSSGSEDWMNSEETYYERRSWGSKAYTTEYVIDKPLEFMMVIGYDNSGEKFIINIDNHGQASVYGIEMPDFDSNAVYWDIVNYGRDKGRQHGLIK